MSVINFIVENYQAIVSSVVAILTSAISISLLIPGDQPEKFLQSMLDFITKFSNKPNVK